MQLYERSVSEKGKVTYREHKEVPDILEDKEISVEEVITMLTTQTISMMMAIEGQLAPHQKLAREIKVLEQAVLRFATFNSAKLDPKLIDVGVGAWNASIRAMQDGLMAVRT